MRAHHEAGEGQGRSAGEVAPVEVGGHLPKELLKMLQPEL